MFSKYNDIATSDCTATYDSSKKYLTQIKFNKICNSKIQCTTALQKIELNFKVKNQPSMRPFAMNSVNKYFSLIHQKDNIEQFKNQYLYLQP